MIVVICRECQRQVAEITERKTKRRVKLAICRHCADRARDELGIGPKFAASEAMSKPKKWKAR